MPPERPVTSPSDRTAIARGGARPCRAGADADAFDSDEIRRPFSSGESAAIKSLQDESLRNAMIEYNKCYKYTSLNVYKPCLNKYANP
jgi:hypothetical protein